MLQGAALGEVPVGAVLVHDGSIVAKSHNLVERLRDPTAHAEMLVIRQVCDALHRALQSATTLLNNVVLPAAVVALTSAYCPVQAAAQGLGRWALQEATLYATLEPCAMCAGAILISRVGTVVYGARSTLLGADGTWMQLLPCQHGAEGADADSTGQGGWQGRPHSTHPKIQVRLKMHATGGCMFLRIIGVQEDTATFGLGCSVQHLLWSVPQVRRGVLSEESGALLKAFFQQRRAEGKSRAAKIGGIVPHYESE